MNFVPIAVWKFIQPLVDVNEAVLKFFHNQLGFGWGMAIVGLTVVIRLAILPLTFKQVRSMQALQRLAPEMKRIQERYKEDKKRQQQEIMRFYQEHQVNPLASCFRFERGQGRIADVDMGSDQAGSLRDLPQNRLAGAALDVLVGQ